jgi:hypothetical protein
LDHDELMKTSRLPLPRLVRLATASLLILSAACGTAQSPPAAQAPGAQATGAAGTAALWQRIQAETADTGCDNNSQCHSMGVGSKACGGPERYLAWSDKTTDGARLKALVDQHSAARRADDKREGMMSTCSLVSDPGAICRANRCTLNGSSAGRAATPPNQQ